jgi:uncharacterized protein (TIGR02001 family)
MTCTLQSSRKLLAAVATALCAGTAFGQTPAPTPAPTPDNVVTANVGLFSEYLFRGIAQTGGKPAIQGGFDWTHSSGFYAGTWGSNVSWLEDFGLYTRSSLELDFYGGYKNTFPGSEDWNYDVGTLYYYYPGKKNPGVFSANTWELYGAVGWKTISLKGSYSLQDYFGLRPDGQKSDGTWYLDLSGSYPFGETGFALVGHFGALRVRHDLGGPASLNYEDWRAGVTYTVPEGVLKGTEFGAYYSGNNAESAPYTDLTGYDTSKDRAVIYVKKTF